ncbi:hypothetical protein HYPSUDRAFT_282608 [Hypholoma sublateritium FD-334 SS-4]|uniref:F-box domain-containing protein n=1 Tax=Hypholoma sublateritium (strain FD-334 SS-4) TaxID=945553 RepID=A0A0D2P706_HYPSF|nr:hypothetical protein HYPSUDRAFT_282608 [Hypholoma sublateritium FD-334 SS-4]
MDTSPIHRLGHDLLLEIFEYNADMFVDPTALDTSLKATQVCLSWRALMLETPWIWGRLIDIDYICRIHASDQWFDELVARAGSAMLWIKMLEGLGRNIAADKVDRFLFGLLEKSWSRVQRLCVAVDASTLDPYSSPRWRWLYLPAPYLEILDIEFGNDFPIPDSSLPLLFSGQAPALQQFKAQFWPFDTHVPWTSGLLSLFVGAPLTLPQLMAVLQKSSGLKMLNIGDIADPVTLPVHLPLIPLRKMQCLGIIGNMSFITCAHILEHIDTLADCSLMYYPVGMNRSTRTFSDDDFARVVRALATFARRFFSISQPEQISLYSRRNDITFMDNRTVALSGYTIMLPCNYENFQLPISSQTAGTFFTTFSLPEFSTVTALRIRFPPHVPLSALATFFACLPAVEELTTDDVGIACILGAQNSMTTPEGSPLVIFPKLKTIHLAEDESPALGPTSVASSESVHAFVAARREAGKSVEVCKFVGEEHRWGRNII